MKSHHEQLADLLQSGFDRGTLLDECRFCYELTTMLERVYTKGKRRPADRVKFRCRPPGVWQTQKQNQAQPCFVDFSRAKSIEQFYNLEVDWPGCLLRAPLKQKLGDRRSVKRKARTFELWLVVTEHCSPTEGSQEFNERLERVLLAFE
jgi:hypothetical protein